jgi:uncharacterized protein (DUF1778 family)
MPASDARTEKLDLRLTLAAKQQLRAAAEASQRSVSEFVLESAIARAQEALADRQRFGLAAEQWAAFTEALDQPVRSMPRAEKLLREPSIFESK